ncbi:hypothetical protein PAT3040_05377 [Paenibacillus agaridevorans]|uniref:Uncharacterized protein n=1 Tax=Paenibacillus agaridevorans TaxID=171404 RepID=A0A2R5EV96_9BACL|nr:hypothetical protein [Paenibacillus agaridevorans]GBG10626.1 hypothetical protein PAT3040_05377 [Paenibacillus agaridevorans]
MFAIAGAVLFAVVAIMTILVAFGLPLGEFTMGGKYKVLPVRLRYAAVISFIVQLFAIVVILQAGGWLPFWFSETATKYICMFFAAYLSLNTVANLFSVSKKEKYAATPLSAAAAICFWMESIRM